MIAWGRGILTLVASLIVTMAVATQLIGALFHQHPALGPGLLIINGVKLYAPWRVVLWTIHWAPRDPWLGFLMVLSLGMCAFAALALTACVAAFAPPKRAWRWLSRDFASWANMGQRGLLWGEGLLLGALRRHALSPHCLLGAPEGHALILGHPANTDTALRAAAASWRGALVWVSANGVGGTFAWRDAHRFAPDRADSIALNPLLSIRGGVHAWSDALTLASGFLRSNDVGLVTGFAALTLDALARAHGPARSLVGIRQALAVPERKLAEFCARWCDAPGDLGPASGELVRIARAWRADGAAALRIFRDLDARLRAFADGDLALACESHQLRFADLVTGDGPTQLLIELPIGKEKTTASLVAALLAQLVSACGAPSDHDGLGRRKQRELLIVIDTAALDALIADPGPPMPAQWTEAHKPPPLFGAALRGASANGVRFLVQASCARQAATLIGVRDDLLWQEAGAAFPAIAAIGPQTGASAAFIGALAGQRQCWRRWRHQRGFFARWLFPLWESGDEWVVAPEMLQRAQTHQAWLMCAGTKPIRCRPLVADTGETASFVAAPSVPAAPHDWQAAPAAPATSSASAALSTPADAPRVVEPSIGGSKLRRALSRRAAPPLSHHHTKPETGRLL